METKIDGSNFTVGNSSRLFFEFEFDNRDYLATLKIQEYSFWQVVKWPILLYCLNISVNRSDMYSKPKPMKTIILFRVIYNISFFFKAIIIFVKLRFNKYPPYLFVTNSADKLSVNEDNLFYNSLMDPVVDYFRDFNIDYLHYEFNKKNKFPSYIDNSFDITNLNLLKIFYFNDLKDFDSFISTFNNYFINKKINISINTNIVNIIVKDFIREKRLWLDVFKYNRPKKIFTSEITNTGFLAACNFRGIDVFEFQHGTIDKNHPAYFIDVTITDNCCPLYPVAYVVFGRATTDILKSNLCSNSVKIIELGKQSIDLLRVRSSNFLSKKVLICLQPLMVDLNRNIIEEFMKFEMSNFSVTIKFHPLQKLSEQDEIIEIVQKNLNFNIASTEDNVQCLIIDHDLTIAHSSNVLVECISLNKPAITIGTLDIPYGILDLLGMHNLRLALRPVFIKDLNDMIITFYLNSALRRDWLDEVEKYKNYFYSNNYKNNLVQLI